MRLTLNINDQKAMFFLELLRTFDFVSIETEASDELSSAHKALLDKRLLKYNTQEEASISWEEVQTKMKAFV
jgi:Putative addiction module component